MVPMSSNLAAELPLILQEFDHYTLIVSDGQRVCDFHCEVLGFQLLRIKDVGVEDPNFTSFAMRNYILAVPGFAGRTCIITQGLAEDSLFTKYLRKFGPGIHHVAYSVQDLPAAFATLRAAGVQFTSAEILRDPSSGLRQVFIERQHAGYFVELIERTQEAQGGYFADINMRRLVGTMASYLAEETPSATAKEIPSIRIERPAAVVQSFMAQVDRLPSWTCHRSVRARGNQFIEYRMYGDVEVSVRQHGDIVSFRFRSITSSTATASDPSVEKSIDFSFRIQPDGDNSCVVLPLLPPLAAERRASTQRLLHAELRLLAGLLQGTLPYPGQPDDEQVILEHSLIVYQRRGL